VHVHGNTALQHGCTTTAFVQLVGYIWFIFLLLFGLCGCRTLRTSMTTWLVKVSLCLGTLLSAVSAPAAFMRSLHAVVAMAARILPTWPGRLSACRQEHPSLSAMTNVSVDLSVQTELCNRDANIVSVSSVLSTAVDGVSRPPRRSRRVASSWSMSERSVS